MVRHVRVVPCCPARLCAIRLLCAIEGSRSRGSGGRSESGKGRKRRNGRGEELELGLQAVEVTRELRIIHEGSSISLARPRTRRQPQCSARDSRLARSARLSRASSPRHSRDRACGKCEIVSAARCPRMSKRGALDLLYARFLLWIRDEQSLASLCRWTRVLLDRLVTLRSPRA